MEQLKLASCTRTPWATMITHRGLGWARPRQQAFSLVTAMQAFARARDACLRNPRGLPEAGRKPVRRRRNKPGRLVILDDACNRSSVFDRVARLAEGFNAGLAEPNDRASIRALSG